MRGRVPFLVLVILGLCVVCGDARAQDAEEQPGLAEAEWQAESPFAEEIKQLDDASDTEARRDAFAAVLAKADELEREPAPLTSILSNKKPEETYLELLGYIRDNAEARREVFLRPLILAANDPGDTARAATAAVKAFGIRAVKPLCAMLGGESAGERSAAAGIAGERPGGTEGVVQIIPHLVQALDRHEGDLGGAAVNSLKRMTLLDYDDPEKWKAWLNGKSERDLLIEIADREADARRKAEDEKTAAERELLKVLLDHMRAEERENAPALVERLNRSTYLAVRLEAAVLLRELLPGQDEEGATPVIDALGGVLNNRDAPEELRKECARALADSGKPGLAFPYIDQALAPNGVSADLKLELVKGLNAPVAADRLAAMLESEVDVVEDRSGAVLETLIAQVRSVVKVGDSSEAKEAIMAQFSRLLDIAAGKIADDELDSPARKRYVDLARQTCDTLVHVARLRQVDVSGVVDSLVRLARTDNGAASAALTALRQALNVPSARENLLERVRSAPIADELALLYQRLIGGNDESRAMLINLLGLYENIEDSPEPVSTLRKRLVERARSSSASLPASPEMRKTVRDALRGLLAKLTHDEPGHIVLLKDLLDADYGMNDALGYLQVLPPSRVDIIVAALQSTVTKKPLELGAMVSRLRGSLTQDELDTREFKQFHGGLMNAVRAEFKNMVRNALNDGLEDDARERIKGFTGGALRTQFIPVAVEELRANADKSEARDKVSEIMLECLKSAHPGKYDDVELKGLERDAFIKEVDLLNARLKNDGYAVP